MARCFGYADQVSTKQILRGLLAAMLMVVAAMVTPAIAAGPPCTTTVECAQVMVELAKGLKSENVTLQKQISEMSERLAKAEGVVNAMEEITLYQCPSKSDHFGGAWATWGCLGQVGSQQYCYNHTYIGPGNAPDKQFACEKVTYWRKRQ